MWPCHTEGMISQPSLDRCIHRMGMVAGHKCIQQTIGGYLVKPMQPEATIHIATDKRVHLRLQR